MIKIQPQGSNILVMPISKENYVTDSGIEIAGVSLCQGEVIEVSKEFAELYKAGDIVQYADSPKVGISQPYNGKLCIWLCGRAFNDGGDIFSTITNDAK